MTTDQWQVKNVPKRYYRVQTQRLGIYAGEDKLMHIYLSRVKALNEIKLLCLAIFTNRWVNIVKLLAHC